MEARTFSHSLAVEEIHSDAEGKYQGNFMQHALCIMNTWQLQDWVKAHKCLFTEIITIRIREPIENNGSTKMLTSTKVRVRLF